MSRSERMFIRGGLALMAVVGLAMWSSIQAHATGAANDGPGDRAAWTTGNKLAIGTSADMTSKVWFTVAKGITTEVFYPRLDVPNMQDLQYIVTDGSTFVHLERDATNHVVSMPDEKALEYTVHVTYGRAWNTNRGDFEDGSIRQDRL
jgi:glucoamylase